MRRLYFCFANMAVITLLITPLIYLYLDRFSGTGPLMLAGDK